MKKYLPVLAAVVALFLLVPFLQERCSTEAVTAQAAQAEPQQPDPVSLEESMAPLVRYFNQGREKPRLLVLLSPT